MPPPRSRPGLPSWVRKRDGRLAPFEADRISQTLFAATEALGQPDAFLARELTDGILHFLSEECAEPIPTTVWLADLIVKVVRELRQPELAHLLTEQALQQEVEAVPETDVGPPQPLVGDVVFHFSTLDAPSVVARHCLQEYTLQAVFSRDLLAAHRDGLLTLGNLNTPLELAGCVLGPPATRSATALIETLQHARTLAGDTLALDSPEHLAALADLEDAETFAHQLRLGLNGSDTLLTLHLNCATPPAWAEDNAGPLFADQSKPDAANRRLDFVDALLSEWRRAPTLGQLHWHLSEADWPPRADADRQQRLLRLARWAVDGAPLAFAFDRPRRPVALGVGLTRKHPATLLQVGLQLPRLLELPGVRHDEELLLKKLASLARLALSAAVQKRAFVRLQMRGADTALTRGFLLERARVVIAPVGLEAAVRTVTGRGLCDGKPALEFAVRLLQRLRDVLHSDGRASLLDTCLDAPWTTVVPALEHVAGLTPWSATAPLRQQLRAAGTLHALAEAGTAALVVPPDSLLSAEDFVELLHFTWRQTDVVRVRLVRLQTPQPLSLL